MSTETRSLHSVPALPGQFILKGDNTPLQYLNEEGVLSSTCTHHIDDETLVKGYRCMATTRYVDDRMQTLQRQGSISFAMSAYGEEGCVVASAAGLEHCDWIYPQYREAGCMHWRGYRIEEFVHSMFCNGKDIILGRQMPNHFGSKALNVVTVSSPIATQISHAAGCAYAMKLQQEKSIALTYFGDGATAEGDFHAGLNFAAVRKAPVIFFCRNNGYAISTRVEKQFSSEGISPKGVGYGMATCLVDGNDFFAVHEVVSKAREYCLAGKGPVLIEAMTYRLGAHSTSDDPSAYRNEEEVQKWKARDPLLRLGRYLRSRGLWDDTREEKMMTDLKEETDRAIHEARHAGKPALETLVQDVYFEVPRSLQEELKEVRTFFPQG